MGKNEAELWKELARFARARERIDPHEWLEKYVTLPHGYPTSDAGRFSFFRFPYWRECVDWVARRERKEIIIWKCSQSGGTECVLQGALRWSVANRPAPVLWVGAQMEQIELFWQNRILPGLTDAGLRMAEMCGAWSSAGMRARAANGATVQATWSSSRAGVKSNSVSLVLADEVSTYDAFTVEKLRPRIENFPTGKIFAISALDHRKGGGTKSDPLWKEWAQTDRREWMMRDPETGEDFSFSMGWRADKGEQKSGVKWAREARRENGSWDLDLVARSAHFVCPSGAIIEEKDRAAMVAAGHWSPTATGRPGAVGYRVPAFLLYHKSFGEIAVEFLRAKKTGKDSLRTFIMEVLAEEWVDEKITIGDTLIDQRRADYGQGEKMSESRTFGPSYVGMKKRVFVSGDVQKLSLYVLGREWVSTKAGRADSGLVDWAEVADWGTFEERTRAMGAAASFVDLRYKWRRGEVIEYAVNYPRIVPCMGSDSRMKNLLRVGVLDAREGRAGGGRHRNGLGYLVFDSWAISWHLFQLMLGREGYGAWRLPRDVSREYVRQATAEEWVEGRAVERHPGSDNHLLDCEKMQVVAALYSGILSPFRSSFTLPGDLGSIQRARQLNLFDESGNKDGGGAIFGANG